MIQLYHKTLSTSSATSPAEAAVRLRFEAREFLRSCLAAELKVPASSLELAHHPSGKPYLQNHSEISFSLSHSENEVAVLVSKKFNVGVDLQMCREVNPRLFARVCTPEELQRHPVPSPEVFYRLWTAKEATMKCIGLGFQYAMNKIDVDLSTGNIHLLEKKEFSLSFNYPWNSLESAEIPAPEGFAGCAVWAPREDQKNYRPTFSLRT